MDGNRILPLDRAEANSGAIPIGASGVLISIEYQVVSNSKTSPEPGMRDHAFPVILGEALAGIQDEFSLHTLTDAPDVERGNLRNKPVAIKPVKSMVGAGPNGSITRHEEHLDLIALLVSQAESC